MEYFKDETKSVQSFSGKNIDTEVGELNTWRFTGVFFIFPEEGNKSKLGKWLIIWQV